MGVCLACKRCVLQSQEKKDSGTGTDRVVPGSREPLSEVSPCELWPIKRPMVLQGIKQAHALSSAATV